MNKIEKMTNPHDSIHDSSKIFYFVMTLLITIYQIFQTFEGFKSRKNIPNEDFLLNSGGFLEIFWLSSQI